MNKKVKAMLLVLCALILVVGSVMGTFAYLTDTKEVVNTFTVGDIKLKLDEAKVDAETGKAVAPAERTEEGNEKIKLIPGREIDKDPTVYVKEGSEAAYIRMIVTVSNYDQMKEAFAYDASKYIVNATTVADMNNSNGAMVVLDYLVDRDPAYWHCVKFTEDSTTNTGTYEFRYFPGVYTVAADNSDSVVDYFALEPLFTTVTVPSEMDNEHLAKLNEAEITITAHAIQAEGFATAALAWDAFTAP